MIRKLASLTSALKPLSQWNCGLWVVGLSSLLLVASSVGCRALRNGRQTRALATARQLSLRGADALQQQKWNDAEMLFSEAIRHSQADERAQWGYAEVLWQQNQRAAASQHMSHAVEMSGGNPDLVVRLGQMYLEQDQLDQAIAQADTALKAQRTHAGAWALRGDALRQQEQLDEALDSYHRSLIYRADSPNVQIAIAQIYRQLGRPQRALATLDNLTDHLPEENVPPRTWLLRGQALADLGELNEAKRCWRHAALCANDTDSELLLELAKSQFDCQDLAEARLCLGRVLRQDANLPAAQLLQSQLDASFQQLDVDKQARVPTLPAGYRK